MMPSIDGHYPLPNTPDKPQAMGSALTYARRYGWGAMLGEASEEDDDANAAQAAAKGGGRQGVTDVTLDEEKTLSKAQSRPVYEELINEMRTIGARKDLTAWGLENTARIYSMHADFQRFFRKEYANHLTALDEGVTEDGKPVGIKQQLKASIEFEDAEVMDMQATRPGR